VAFLQTHDQVGNRALGERIDAVADAGLMPAALACVLLAPQVPMLFMGEEYAASTPFLFFCDFEPALAEAVRVGRREEFARFEAFRDPAAREAIPDPNAAGTFAASKLRWHERDAPPHAERLALVRLLLQVRRAMTPLIGRIRQGGRWRAQGSALTARWNISGGEPNGAVAGDPNAAAAGQAAVLALHVNFGSTPMAVDVADAAELRFAHALAPGDGPGQWKAMRGGVLLALERGRG
jgi:maltooligosyltrehalose trehalohydrolase